MSLMLYYNFGKFQFIIYHPFCLQSAIETVYKKAYVKYIKIVIPLCSFINSEYHPTNLSKDCNLIISGFDDNTSNRSMIANLRYAPLILSRASNW